jgi:hypothetical protein
MATKNVLVEICLTSNDVILGVSGARHPLPVYMQYGVPVALATDDEGVSRSDMTHEYLRAAETYGLSYAELKRMARASLEHSFIAGDSLWNPGSSAELERVAVCADEKASGDRVSAKCAKFLAASERARAQWKLERAFSEFEKQF